MRKSLSVLSPITLLFLILISTNIIAQVAVPDSPAGEKLQLLLDVLSTENHKSFIESNFSDNFLNQFPMEDHFSFFNQVNMIHGGFELYEIESADDYNLTVIVKSKKMETWRRLEIAVEPKVPYKINGVGLDMAPPPEGVEYTGPIYELVSKTIPDNEAIIKNDLAEKIDLHMTKMEEQGYSGAVIVAKGDDIIIAKGYGFANRENKIPFHRNSAFDIGSITKQFTGAAILKLEMEDKLSVQDLITKYFENVPSDKKEITIHHLLTHSAGFAQALGFDYKTISRYDFIALAFKSELIYVPGERYEYSNVGYSLLAAIIEIISGKSYDKFLYDNLFEPAGMFCTGYKLPNWKKNQVVDGYSGDEHFGQPDKMNWDDDGPWWHLRGNGGLLSTIDDMYKWHRVLLGEKILSKEAKAKYYAPHVKEEPGDTYYGYGWVIAESSRGTKVYMHNGGNPYFANDCYRYIEDDVFVYITSNNGAVSAIDQSGIILRIIFK